MCLMFLTTLDLQAGKSVASGKVPETATADRVRGTVHLGGWIIRPSKKSVQRYSTSVDDVGNGRRR